MRKLVLLICFAAVWLTSIYAEPKVLAFAGSTRKDSYNKKLILAATEIARQEGATVTLIDLKDFPMPLYDADLEASQGLPENAKRLRNLMISHDKIMIASPEYNGSMPAVLKNSLDWASRGEDGNWSNLAFKGKKFAIMSASPGKGGGARALVHLRSVIETNGGIVLSNQATIPNAHQYFAKNQGTTNVALKEEVEQLLK
jgi:chromate reductase, NAD(P)H dehydrogenase (quinone)